MCSLCGLCDTEHPAEHLELTFQCPDAVVALQTVERARRVRDCDDLCVLDHSRFFVRALLPLRVIGTSGPYRIGIWVEVRQADFERIVELWDEADTSSVPAFEATLANDIPGLPCTSGLRTYLVLAGATDRPTLALKPAEHPLVAEQVRGITPIRAREYTAMCG